MWDVDRIPTGPGLVKRHGVLDANVDSPELTDKFDAKANAVHTHAQADVTGLVTDLAAKAPLASPTFTGTVVLPSTTSIGTVSSTELGYVDGVTSSIQTQLNGKAATAHTHAQADVTNLTTDLAAKAPLASPTFTGVVTAAAGSAGTPSVTFTGATSDTGLYSPGADQVSIATAGTERLRIDSAGLITGTGTSLGAWTSYTPTLAGGTWAIGNGTAAGLYCRIGKVVHYKIKITFGSTSAYDAATAPTLSLPVTAISGSGNYGIDGVYYDSSTAAFYVAAITYANTTTLRCYYTSTTSGQMSLVTSTQPFTWATGDLIQITGTYEAA
jgi:hypothetical protein